MSRDDGSVAVVGIGCRYAGGVRSAADLWALLRAGTHTDGELPPDRWRPDHEHSREHAAALTRVTARGSFLDGDVDAFDAAFFGIPAAEAEQLDPQQRLALEVAWEALEDAGIVPASLAGTSAAVYLGVGTDDHGRRLLADLPHVRPWTGIGASLCGVPNRVSHALDLRGPSVAVDTACSSSLVAIHQACTALRAGETDLVLAGGVMLMTGPGLTAVLVEAGALGPDGRSKPFSAAADGYGRGEGAGVVVLKRLADARAAGDDVLAVIRGGAVRQDGRTDGIMAPSGDAQQDLMRDAYAAADVDPATVGYVEAHGTGTPAGDPMEASALCGVLARDATAAPGRIGAVKASIGHTEAAAGVAGLIAATLALRHQYVPGIAGLTAPRTDVAWDDAHVHPAVGGADWPDPGHPRRAGVASYGYGGTIAHLVLEEGDPVPADDRSGPGADLAGPTPFVLSAASPEALAEQAGHLAGVVSGRQACATADIEPPVLADVAHTLARHRAALRHRAVVTAPDRDTLVTGLTALAAGDPHGSVVTGDARRPGGAVWVFSGHGQQWVGMGRGLLDVDPDFTAVIDRLEPVYRAELGVGPRQVMTADDLGGVDRIQATLCAVQLGLAASWRARGAEPAAVIGHSVGEIAAAVVAGALTEADAARLVCRRSALLPRVAGHGAMVLVDLPFEECTDLVPGAEAAIAAAPSSTVVAGDVAAVEEQARRFEAAGRTVRRVDSDVAFHTAQMAPLAEELRAAVATLEPSAPTVPLYATARPEPRAEHRRDADYWADNLRCPVRFADAVAAAHADGHRTFLEVSAHPVVAHSLAEGAPESVVVPSLRRNRPEPEELARAAAALHGRGVPVDLDVPAGRRTRLPGVAWQRRALRVERRPATRPGPASTLLGAPVDVHGTGTRVWSTTLHDRTRPYPGHHPVLGVEIVPAAVTLATYLAAGEGALRDVTLTRPVVVPGEDEDPAELQVVRTGDTLRLATRPAGGTWGEHSSARIGTTTRSSDPDPDPAADEPLDPGHVVDRLAALGVAAMGFDWEVARLRRGDGVLVATVAARDWPALLDAALSTASVVFDEPALRMPAAIAAVDLDGPAPASAEVVVVRTGDLTVDVVVRGGGAAARLYGLRYAEPEATDTRPELGETVFVLDLVPGEPGSPVAPVPDDARGAVRDLLDAVRAGERRPVALPGPDDGSGAWAAAGLARVLATEHPELIDEPVAADGARLRAVPLGPGSSAPVCRPDATYLVTGGSGAVGRAVAAHLAARGARRLVLLGRHAPDRASGAFDAIERAGATVFAVAADVTDADAVRAALDALPVPPVRGVVHAAGAVRSGPALDLTDEDLEVTLAAKADGAAVLDALFPAGELDFLVLFSSVGPLLGLPGQGAYAAANACLDGLAARRRAAGDTGTVSIAWTSWEGLGMARSAAATDVELDARGTAALAPERALAALDRILAGRHGLPGTGTVAVLGIRTDHTGPRPALLDALELDVEADDGDTPWAGLSGDELHAAVAAEARAAAGAVVGIDPEDLDPQLALTAQGVDSLLAASLRVRLERRTGVALAPTVLWNHPTLDALGAHLTEKLEDA